MADKVIVFRDESGAWRWHQLAANGEVVATSGESFQQKANALRAAVRQAGDAGHIEVENGMDDEPSAA